MAVVSADAPSRWLFSGVAALAAHGVLLLGSPDAGRARIEAPEPVYVSIEMGVQDGATAGSSAGSPAPESVAAVAPRRRSIARPRTSASAHVASEERRVAPTEPPAELRADVGADVGANDVEAVASAVGAEGDSEGGSNSGLGLGTGSGTGAGVGVGSGSGGGHGAVVTRPALIASRNPCDGFFPTSAHVDHGSVQIQVRVDEQGHVSVSEIMVEAPLGHDFGRAARACASALRFAPARDALGAAVAGEAKLELTFHRS